MALLVGVATIGLLAGCTSAGGAAASDTSSTVYASGGTFTMGVSGDPGTLNPLNNTSTSANWLFRFLYDPLVTRSTSGKITSGLASKWTFDGTTAVFTIKKGVTCSDGSAVTPSVIAKNFAWIQNPANTSTEIGAVLPNRNFTYSADDAASTFTLKLDAPFSLLLSSLSFMPIVCGTAASNPATLTTTSSGSGPFVLTQATPNSQYVMKKRTGYKWGANGASTSAAGTPSTVVFKIVPDETTAANLILSGQVNAAVINGKDRARLKAAGTKQTTSTSGGVVMSFNEAAGRITSDKNVRIALTMATDRAQVASTVTQGLLPKAGTSVSAAEPQVCNDSSAAKAIPAHNVAKAKALLTKAGWKVGSNGTREKDGKELSLVTGYSTATPGASTAVELIASEWKAVGVNVVITPMTQADYTQRVFGTGDYDVMPVEQFSNPFPSTLTGLLSGPVPPAGTNAGHINNPQYTSLIAKAEASSVNSGCAYWTQASKALFTNADMIPMANWPTNWVLKGAKMSTLGGRPIATSIRLLKN
jgi:peptide/nickel transport system substrate-binding protein